MNDSDQHLTTKQKIIKVTMDIIAVEGFHNITIRKIASRAGVNVAAVNYHFGSKDGVIDAALATVMEEMKKTFALLNDHNLDVKSRLFVFIEHYIEIINKYPDIIKNLIDHAIHNKPLDTHIEYMIFLKTEGIESIKAAIAEARPAADELTLHLRALLLLSGLSFPVLMGNYIREAMGIDLNDDKVREPHVLLLLESVLGNDCCQVHKV